jgi:DNA-binding response OmpR family regulator
MVKVLIARNLCTLLQQGNTFLQRANVKVFPADSNDEVLHIHRMEHVDLIITQIDMPGMNSEQLYSLFREDKDLHSVPVIMVCTNHPGEIEKCARCGVSDVILRPVNKQILLARAQQFLALLTRESSRVSLNVAIDVSYRNQTFPCRSVDICASGMMIETDKVLTLGDRIVCSFSLPGSQQLRTEVEIVNALKSPRGAQGNRYGVHFTNLPAEAMQSLQTFVELSSRTAA